MARKKYNNGGTVSITKHKNVGDLDLSYRGDAWGDQDKINKQHTVSARKNNTYVEASKDDWGKSLSVGHKTEKDINMRATVRKEKHGGTSYNFEISKPL